MWDIKVKVRGTDRQSIVVTTGKGVGVAKGYRGQIHGDRR